MPDHSRGPRFMAQAKHLFTGVAEGAMADVMKERGGVQQGAMRFESGVERQQTLKGLPGEMEHAE